MTNLQIAHTPTPWFIEAQAEVSAHRVVTADASIPVADIRIIGRSEGGFEKAEDAAFIVKACNAHYELVQALRKARTHVRYRAWSSDEEKKECGVLGSYIDAVLAKLEGAK